MFILSTGAEATDRQLTMARQTFATEKRNNARLIMAGEWGYADHVTAGEMLAGYFHQLCLAEEILAGEHDAKIWCWQKLNYLITGESVPVLSF